MSSLREANIFRLKPLISNFHAKLSTVTEYDPEKQIVCLVSDDNEVLLRYTNDAGADTLKLVSWFKKSTRVIHDVCFDPSGTWLLVLCFDNTLHIVPALHIVDNKQVIANSVFSTTEVTSFVIPFVGPHECPNSKTCPNCVSTISTISSSPLKLDDYTFDFTAQKSGNEEFDFINNAAGSTSNNITDVQGVPYKILGTVSRNSSTDTSTSKQSSKVQKDAEFTSTSNHTNSINHEHLESFLSSSSCPFPTCVVWWQTLDRRNKAIIGYSDGSICFVGLTPNCPFLSNSSLENGGVLNLIICRDNNMENVTLLINSSIKEQWKLLLEQKSIKYTFPGDGTTTQSNDNGRDDWQIVTPIKSNNGNQSMHNLIEDDVFSKDEEYNEDSSPSQKTADSDDSISANRVGLFPAAKARLASLKDLGAKKFFALKLKLSDKYKMGVSDESLGSFAIMDSPSMSPEILTTAAGPYFTVQNLRNTFLLSALHSYSDMLSVHRMDVSLIPVFLYKIPQKCQEVLISSNILYSVQITNTEPPLSDVESMEQALLKEVGAKVNVEEDKDSPNMKKSLNAVGVISSAMASIKTKEEDFDENSLLGIFSFEDEKVVNIHRMASYTASTKPNLPKEESNDTLQLGEIKTPGSYIRLHRKLRASEFYSQRDFEIMQNEFPKINYDPCIVVTNKNTYFIELKNEPHVIFLNAAISGSWLICEEFCNTFDLSFSQCIEFAGDFLLRKKKITQALFTYNIARIPPVRTALKLAMFGENFALMQLCALALKSIYILKSKYPSNRCIKYLFPDTDKRHSEDIAPIIETCSKADNSTVINDGKHCSDYVYGVDESISSLQMTASSQFHLSNLLLITLVERAVKEKNYFPVWNFIASNSKFHTNMTSIVLCQSGLFSAALLLAMIRGACFDSFVGLISVSNQEFGWYSELNVLLYNLSETIFRECITYLRHISADYFSIIQTRLDKIEQNVLKRLEHQMNPFLPVFRPIVSQLSSRGSEEMEENTSELLDFCKLFIETYLSIVMQIESHKMKRENVLNALNTFRLNYEENQFAIKTSNFPPLSAGCSHCACVIDGSAYFWGSNGIPFIYTVSKPSDPPDPPHVVKSFDILSQLNLEVHAVKCGRQHSLILTNNGVYAIGSNQLGQLGIGKQSQAALQPMLIDVLDGRNITILESGQYHNAVVADGLLYTWGWGVFGQLGHGDIENTFEPKITSFFRNKNVIQVSLGHGHSLVLCKSKETSELYVFGSNHFGQLGIGQSSDDNKSGPNKLLIPLKLNINEENIRLIHTKFFTTFAVTDENKLYTWGSSPQALRLANQIKKRANAKLKIEENFKKEINKKTDESNENKELNGESTSNASNQVGTPLRQDSVMQRSNSSSVINDKSTPLANLNNQRRHSNPQENLFKDEMNSICTSPSLPQQTIENADSCTCANNVINTQQSTSSANNGNEMEPTTSSKSNLSDEDDEKSKQSETKSSGDEDIKDHLSPQLVDTSEVSGNIIQISTGVFHNALISSTSVLYTWGKNLEHQLGTEDKDRKAIARPTAIDTVENPLYIECGADFTLVMTTDFAVKAFGGNTNGQCGRDLGPPIDKSKPGKIFCLPTTKRLMRLEGQCIECPTEINLPRPSIKMVSTPTRYLKSVPMFKTKYLVKASLGIDISSKEIISSNLVDYYPESEDLASSIENISLNDEDSECSATTRIKNLSSNDISPTCDLISSYQRSSFLNKDENQEDSYFRHYIHYCLYVFHGLYDPDRIYDLSENNVEFRVRILMLNYKYVSAFSLCLKECKTAPKSIKIFEFFTKDPSIVPMRRKDLKFFIHQLFTHFISKNLDLNECEDFFITDLDYYLLELAYVLYFNNNNTELEQSLNQKFKNFLEQDMRDNQDYSLDETDIIFENLSTKFKALICQRMLSMCNNTCPSDIYTNNA